MTVTQKTINRAKDRWGLHVNNNVILQDRRGGIIRFSGKVRLEVALQKAVIDLLDRVEYLESKLLEE